MISKPNNLMLEVKKNIFQEIKIVREIIPLLQGLERADASQKKMIDVHLNGLKNSLKNIEAQVEKDLSELKLVQPLKKIETVEAKPVQVVNKKIKKSSGKRLEGLEKVSFKRLSEKKEKAKKVFEKRMRKPNMYVNIANRIFSKTSTELAKKDAFRSLKRNLTKANLQFLPASYISVILFTTLLSFIFGIFVFVFFLFLNIGAELPIVIPVDFTEEKILDRLLKVFWILFVIPIGTFLFMYFYPSMEKKSAENKIDQELPFATIHMASISGSMIDPSKIFNILINTGEYPGLTKEFTKLMNEINVYGFDLVSALRRGSITSPSKKLSELYNGLATTITSGGDLPEFFNKRSESFLFEYRLEREKYTRAAETFMDIYISVVIAAPMILMLLLMMMRVSGLGIGLSAGTITLIMVLGVSMINIIFLTFLQLKQPSG